MAQVVFVVLRFDADCFRYGAPSYANRPTVSLLKASLPVPLRRRLKGSYSIDGIFKGLLGDDAQDYRFVSYGPKCSQAQAFTFILEEPLSVADRLVIKMSSPYVATVLAFESPMTRDAGIDAMTLAGWMKAPKKLRRGRSEALRSALGVRHVEEKSA